MGSEARKLLGEDADQHAEGAAAQRTVFSNIRVNRKEKNNKTIAKIHRLGQYFTQNIGIANVSPCR